MNELQKELDTVFKILSSMPVAGDNVEMMATAKEHLRKAFTMAASEKEKPSYESLEEQ